MSEKKQLFVVESVCTFYEVHLVEAENEEQAKKIADQSDYNASKWLGTQVANVTAFDERDLPRLKRVDSYFFDGYACVDEEGDLYYRKMNGEFNGNMPKTKVFEKSSANVEKDA
jgi:hypothetical protein